MVSPYVERALEIIDRLRDDNKINIREKGCLRRAILEQNTTWCFNCKKAMDCDKLKKDERICGCYEAKR